MITNDDIRWFKQQFQRSIIPAIEGTPYTLDMITAIACQEMTEVWPVLRKLPITIERLLELCVGDTLDGASKRPRTVFPRNKAELIAEPNGERMFEIARNALIEMAPFIKGAYLDMVKIPTKICHGFGIFQYDLQHFKKTDPAYFLEKKYANFDTCLARCINELNTQRKRIKLGEKTALTDMEMAYVAIAYNAGGGNFVKKKGLKQGHQNGKKFYGELFFEFLQQSKGVTVDPDADPPMPFAAAGTPNGVTSNPIPHAVELIGITNIPKAPRAGEPFTVVVQLNREVQAADGDIQVNFDVKRLVSDEGRSILSQPLSFETYFAGDSAPGPILVPAGSRTGMSQPIRIDPEASGPDGIAVHFPEKLLFSLYLNDRIDGFLSDVIQIDSDDLKTGPVITPGDAANQTPRLPDLKLKEMVPNKREIDAVGLPATKIVRGTREFAALVKNTNPDVVFKNEDPVKGADQMMTGKLSEKVDVLAALVKKEWPDLRLRVTEAWDENNEHALHSVHYEARGIDITTSDVDRGKLGRLGRLAVEAGFEWVWYEDAKHVHASVSK